MRRAKVVALKDITSFMKMNGSGLTKIGELDRVLGGGIVPGSLVLVGGIRELGNQPFFTGVQKSWQCQNSVLYISGEGIVAADQAACESNGRKFSENFLLLCETNLETIREVIEKNSTGYGCDRFNPDNVS